MDRDRLQRWLKSTHRTWRWNHGSAESYEGVETTDDGLRWFRWSHAIREDGVHGEHDVELQSWAAYRDDGPARDMPDAMREQLDEWLVDNGRS